MVRIILRWLGFRVRRRPVQVITNVRVDAARLQ
jgi:hypothetical protein